MKVLVTGAAGFIGFHLSYRLLERGDHVVGVDNLNDYYDVNLKKSRLALIQEHPNFTFEKLDVADKVGMETLFKTHQFDRVVHLAAQAGVRYSLENPYAYIDSNIQGFITILEGCRHNNIEHLVYASSSSVYGSNVVQPFSERHSVDHPISLYAATKKSNELMAHTYSHLYGLPTTGLRFFTVYGPWGRPDMALFMFTKGIIEGKPITIFNHGDMIRDFTYVDDIVEGVIRTLDATAEPDPDWEPKQPDPSRSAAPFRVFNIGNNNPVKLMDFVNAIEQAVGVEAIKEFQDMQPGDVPSTYADVSQLEEAVGFKPCTSIEQGVKNFVGWYREYYGV